MDWLNLHIPTVLRSPEFIGEDPTNQATWLKLSAFCAAQENGGTISGCDGWKCRKWQQICAVTKEEVRRESSLWEWNGNDLKLVFYPAEKEAEVRMKREIAKTNGKRSGGRPRNQQETNVVTDVGLLSEPTSAKSAKAEGEGERKGKGKEGEHTPRAAREECARLAEAIVGIYPKRERQADALAEIKRQIEAGEDADAMETGTRAIAAIIPRMPSGHLNRFVPSAFEFFRGKRYQDDPETWLRGTPHHHNGGRQETLDLNGRTPGRTIQIPAITTP